MNALEVNERCLLATRHRMIALSVLLAFFVALYGVVAYTAPRDWRLSIFAVYALIPLLLLVANALFYTDCLIYQFENTPMCPVQDMIMPDWDVDDITIEPIFDEGDEDE